MPLHVKLEKEKQMTIETVAPAAVVESPAPPASQSEHMIPKSRLDEVLESNRKLQEKLATTEKERQDQLEAQLKEQGKWKEIAEQRAKEMADLKPKAEQADAIEATLKDVLASQIAELPETMRGLVPDELSTQQKLQWLSKNKPLLVKQKPVDIGAGKQGGGQPAGVELTAEEQEFARNFGVKPEEYAKFKFK